MLLDLTSWWLQQPPSEQIFWSIGFISNVLFIIYVAVQFLGGHDTDFDAGHDSDYLGILSIRGLLAFGMFLGWTGLVVMQAGFGMAAALVAGALAGLLASWLAWRLILLLLRLQVSGTLDPERVVGQTGSVHLRIPAKQNGMGKVMVEVQGALRELDAVSEAGEIPTGSSILIVGRTADGAFVAQPFEHVPDKQI